jgi:tripartite ATP-independent transporter DctM subunit
MILYCVVARTYIFDVFIAAVVPALITITANLIAIALVVNLQPQFAPVADRVPRQEKLAALWRATPAVLLIATIFIGLYSGIFTVAEAASVAAVVSFVFAMARRTVTIENFVTGLRDTAAVAGMIYFILIGSSVFTYFISLPMIPEQLIAFLSHVSLPPLGIIALMLVCYLVLGSIFDELAAMIVTLPFALPIIVHFGYDPVWWGIINVIIVELGLVIPPIGLVILIIHAMRPDIALPALYRSILPFVVADMLVLTLLTLFPTLALWLPALLHG